MERQPNGPRVLPNVANSGRTYQDKRRTSKGTEAVSWNNIDHDAIALLVQAGTAIGGCIILGITTDGGALSITAIIGNDRVKDYPRTSDGVREFASWLAQEYA